METYALKTLTERGIERALAKAEQYRALNEPDDAESICRDVIAVSKDHQGAIVLLGLSLTDQFPRAWSRLLDEALDVFAGLTSDYDRAYYTGIAWERCAKAQSDLGQTHNAAHSFARAMAYFEEAQDLAADDVPDPVLRWNRCVRALQSDAKLLEALREDDPVHHLGD